MRPYDEKRLSISPLWKSLWTVNERIGILEENRGRSAAAGVDLFDVHVLIHNFGNVREANVLHCRRRLAFIFESPKIQKTFPSMERAEEKIQKKKPRTCQRKSDRVVTIERNICFSCIIPLD